MQTQSTLDRLAAATTQTCCPSTPSTGTNTVRKCQLGNVTESSKIIGGHQDCLPAAIDLEKGSPSQHVVILISGMTCSGCERKLQYVLSGIPQVRNVQTSLVLRRAEFDVDPGVSRNGIVSALERQTDFKCSLYQQDHQLEVLASSFLPTRNTIFKAVAPSSKSAKDLESLYTRLTGPNKPQGVRDVQIFDQKGREWQPGNAHSSSIHWFGLNLFAWELEKKRVRITYDPWIMGARDLLGKSFGTPLSLAPSDSNSTSSRDKSHLWGTFYITLLSACLTIPVLVMAWAPLPPRVIVYGCSSLALATLVQCVVAGPFYSRAVKTLLFSRMIEMDLLIVISSTTAYVYSLVAFAYEVRGRPLSTGGFFQTSTLLITLIMVGRLASAYARHKAVDSISIQNLQPSTAIISNGNQDEIIDIRLFQYGDQFKVQPDSVVPTDGISVAGETEIDESMITGEAIPVPKLPGSQVVAGTVNGPGLILVRLNKLPIDNTVSNIASMVDEAKMTRPRVQETADRVASYFVPCILALTLIVLLIWVVVGKEVRHASSTDAIINAISYALSVLIVSCPCAIGLAVPMVIIIAGGVGARSVYFRAFVTYLNLLKRTFVLFQESTFISICCILRKSLYHVLLLQAMLTPNLSAGMA